MFKRLEVVEVGLDLRPLGHGEAHADEEILEPITGLGDRMQVPTDRRVDDLGEIEPLGLEGPGPFSGIEVSLAPGQRRLEPGSCVVQRLTHAPPFVGVEATELALEPAERRLLAQDLCFDGAQLVEGLSRGEPRLALGADLLDVADHQALTLP